MPPTRAGRLDPQAGPQLRAVPGAQGAGGAGTQTAYDIDVADVEYLRHEDKPLLARLFKPRGSGPFPIMVELHGGAWFRGDRLNGSGWTDLRNTVIDSSESGRGPSLIDVVAGSPGLLAAGSGQRLQRLLTARRA